MRLNKETEIEPNSTYDNFRKLISMGWFNDLENKPTNQQKRIGFERNSFKALVAFLFLSYRFWILFFILIC